MHLGLRQSISSSRIISVCITALGYWFVGVSSFETIFLDTTTKIQLPKRLFSGYHYPAQEVFSSTPLTIEVIPNCWAFSKQPPSLFSTYFLAFYQSQPQISAPEKIIFCRWNKLLLLNKNREEMFQFHTLHHTSTYKQYIYHSYSFTILSGCRGRRVILCKQNQYLNISQCSLKSLQIYKKFWLLTSEKYVKNYISCLFSGRYFSIQNNIRHTKCNNFKWMNLGYPQEPEFHSD